MNWLSSPNTELPVHFLHNLVLTLTDDFCHRLVWDLEFSPQQLFGCHSTCHTAAANHAAKHKYSKIYIFKLHGSLQKKVWMRIKMNVFLFVNRCH